MSYTVILQANVYQNSKISYLSRPGADVPVNVQTIGCELYCDITS